MSGAAALRAHLASGTTTVCRAWSVTRRDGVTLGFTDHDRDLAFDGFEFAADAGMTARALEQTTGLAVDNSEALGALSHPKITETDIRDGRFDGAEVRVWQVNWADPDARRLIFRGSLGEIERGGGAFRAELRGLAEALNRPNGRVYQRACGAVLGDGDCGVDTDGPGVSAEAAILSIEGGTVLVLPDLGGFGEGWFTRGRISVLDGAAAGAVGVIRRDGVRAGGRRIDLWEMLSAGLASGDRVRLEPGCDKSLSTCRAKFDNIMNFRGFPDIPGEDWLMAYPSRSARTDGGSRRS